MIQFNVEQMKKLVAIDNLIKFQVKMLGNTDKALESVFNSEVLGDSVMEQKYKDA